MKIIYHEITVVKLVPNRMHQSPTAFDAKSLNTDAKSLVAI